MAIKAQLEQVIRNLEVEREREVAIIKEKAMSEKVAPYNKEADNGRDLAIAELQQNMIEEISAIQEKFTKEKQAIIEENERRKENNTSAVLTSAVYEVTAKYDRAISKLKTHIEELND